jgi:2-iminobutanoate/2-iminopropanoate deaminase
MANRHVVSGKESKMADGNPAYSSAVVSGNTIYLAGVTSGRDANGQVVGRGDIEKQVIATGATFADLTKVTVFATKPEYRAKIGEIRARYFSQPPPASTFVVISGLADPDFLVEIEATAVKG